MPPEMKLVGVIAEWIEGDLENQLFFCRNVVFFHHAKFKG
jgi:hypothetical protein